MRKARRVRGQRDAFVDGGDGGRPSDGSARCTDCDAILQYSLTEAGLKQELDYWRESGETQPLEPGHAYEVRAVLDAALRFGSDEDVADTVAIGEAMAPLLPAVAPAP